MWITEVKKETFMKKISGKFLKIMKKYHQLFQKIYGKRQIESYGGRSKSAKMYQKHQTKYPLSGKIYCEKHQCGFVRKIRHYKEKQDITFWYCSDFHKTGKKDCIPSYFKEEDLYNILLSTFKTYKNYKEEVTKELLNFYNQPSKQEESSRQESKLQNELKGLERKKDRILDLALDGLLSKEDFGLKKLAVEKQINQIKSKLKELESKKRAKQQLKMDETTLRESIQKELEITRDNLESYIEELLDKIIVIEKESKKEVEIKIILAGNKTISYGRYQKLRQISSYEKIG